MQIEIDKERELVANFIKKHKLVSDIVYIEELYKNIFDKEFLIMVAKRKKNLTDLQETYCILLDAVEEMALEYEDRQENVYIIRSWFRMELEDAWEGIHGWVN